MHHGQLCETRNITPKPIQRKDSLQLMRSRALVGGDTSIDFLLRPTMLYNPSAKKLLENLHEQSRSLVTT